jgi:hypothetical protein
MRRIGGIGLAVAIASCKGEPVSERPPAAPATASDAGSASEQSDAGATVPTPRAGDEFRVSRQLEISDLEGIVRPPSGLAETTAALGRRKQAARRELSNGLRIETRCGKNWCIDGLAIADRVLIGAEPDADEARVLRDEDGAWLERVIRIAWQDDAFVSVYVAESSFSDGAAHANNHFTCRSFERRAGRAVSLRDVLPATSAKLLLAKMRGLFNPEVAAEELGETLDTWGFELKPEGFRFGRTAEYTGSRPEIILCAESASTAHDGAIVELKVEAMPVSYLLR